MQAIRSFQNLTDHLAALGRRFRIAVVCGQDASTCGAALRAVREGTIYDL